MNSEHVEVLRQAIAELRQGSIPALRRATAVQKAESAIAALSAQQPGDWVLVPRKPTPEMVCAGFLSKPDENGFVVGEPMDAPSMVWRAMLRAAPQPPVEAHCATCACVPGMTPAIRFDATAAEKEGAVREQLIRMGWTPPAEAQVPSYDGLLIIAQSVCGALERAGITDCDDPGEAIDVLRERYEAQAQGGGERPRLAMPDHIGLYQGPDDCPHLQLNGVSVAVFPAGSWSEVCDVLDSITGSIPPPSAPVGVEGLAGAQAFLDWNRNQPDPPVRVGHEYSVYEHALARQPAADSPSFTAGDMADAAAQGFRDGVASVGAVGVEAYLVERLTGTGYGRARSIVDAAIYNPTEPAFWIDLEAQAQHRVTPLVPALAQHPAAVDGASAWKPISEAPTGKLCIVGWQVVEAGEYPDRHEFDFIEDGRWVHHDEHADHAAAVAPPGSKMPTAEPPYQWFIEVPDFPDLAAQQGERDND